MKNKYLIPFLLFVLKATTCFCVTHIILPTGSPGAFMFSPDVFNANLGDTISFQLGSDHFPIEVDSTTWANNQDASNGGFQFSTGTHIYVINQVKTYYYVCGYHYSMGMKGRFIVSSLPTGIQNIVNSSVPALEVYPNPVTNKAVVRTNLPVGKANELRIFDMTGKCIYQENNVAPSYSFDITGIPSGVYFLTIKAEDAFLEKKLIVSK